MLSGPGKRLLRSGILASLLGCILTPAGHAQDCTNPSATPSVCAYDAVKHAAARTKIKGVLLYDWTVSSHDRSHAQNSMMRLARKYGFRLDRSQSQTYITPAALQGIDLIVFNNGSQDPLQNPASLATVRDFVEKQGKGILVLHAGAEYIPCPEEDIAHPDCRWIMRGVRTQWRMHNIDNTPATVFADSVIAGEVAPRATGISAVPSARNHGRKHPETRMIFENLPTNGGAGPLAGKPYIWEGLGDEWFNFQNNPRLEGERVLDGVSYGPINILLSLDESSVASNATCNGGSNACKNLGTFGDRPVAWTRKIGNGNLAYQSAGHSDVNTRPRVVGGVTVNDSLIEKFNWRLMKYLARDFVGCMDSSDSQYNPEASVVQLNPGVDPVVPCSQPGDILPPHGRREIHLATQGRLVRLDLGASGPHRILVWDVRGRPTLSRAVKGPGRVSLPVAKSGRYFLKVSGPDGESASAFAVAVP